MACAAALAVIDVIKDENVLDNVKQRGKQLERGGQRTFQELSCLSCLLLSPFPDFLLFGFFRCWLPLSYRA